MDALLPIAVKSFLIAGGALLLLRLMRNRSAADRSWIAHLGLAGMLVLPIVALALPSWDVESRFAGTPVEAAASSAAIGPMADVAVTAPTGQEAASSAATFPVAGEGSVAASVDWTAVAYSAPAALLVLVTLIALARLFLLKARATVLVEPHWLTAMARAQQRMGFKHGTALLTSDDLPSPISWGVVRPVILLNSEAARSHAEAEAIITHELAHVARLDWAKLLLARVVCALFWFNPLVWLLAREAHQLREEAADDAVLNADIEDTDYARLLVGVARHECRGLLIGAHGVAPAKNSLARRVRRVLDSASKRAPGGWRWGSAVAFFAAGMAVPVAALNIVPPTVAPALAADLGGDPTTPYYSPALAAGAASASMAETAELASAAAAHPHPFGIVIADPEDADGDIDIDEDADVDVDVDVDIDEDELASVGPSVARAVTATQRAGRDLRDIDEVVSAAIHGVSPAYAREMRQSAPQLAKLTTGELVSLRIQGIDASYVRGIQRSGIRWATPRDLVNMRVQGVTGGYAASLATLGLRNLSAKQIATMRIHGVTPQFISRVQARGFGRVSPEDIVRLKIHGVDPDNLPDP